MSVVAATLVTVFACVVTWLCVSARWRGVQEELLAKIANLQDDATRARVHTAQVTQATAEWNAGYKQGCSDMIKAMAAMHGGGAGDQLPPEGTTHTK
jgi:DMSO/TMAO reductase YedYZ molybdopterin-dependent catalytic subunit